MNKMNDTYEQRNPFSVPEGYFDSLEDRVMSRVREEERPRRTRLTRVLRPFMGWAALLAIVVLAARWAFTGSIPYLENVEVSETQLDADFNPTSEEILEYLTQEVDLAVLSNEILGK
jgi:hypothetical protein